MTLDLHRTGPGPEAGYCQIHLAGRDREHRDGPVVLGYRSWESAS